VIIDSICKPLIETVVSSRVDYGLVIGMIRSLLVSTRISLEEENSELIAQLDFLLGRLDAIRMIINSNCNTKEIISYALSNSDNSILKLQEKLIEMERFELARDLATKFGFDSKSIWKTWAFVCLKYCQFLEAREKFRQVFDINKTAERNKILENIIDILSKHKYSNNISIRDECIQIKTGKFNANGINSRKNNSETNDLLSINPKVYKEMIYYLEEYGNKEDIIKFHAKHSMWRKAIDILLKESSNLNINNIFIRELFMPAVKRGDLSALLNVLKVTDPALNRIWRCLLATCKYLNNNNMYVVLHVLQVFMGDYLRAAITQINCFFLNPPASDYMELNSRIEHLQTAKQHCTDFLNLSPGSYRSGCLVMEKEDVRKQIRTLNLQIDITMRFNAKQIKGFLPSDVSSDPFGEDRSPPTILDHNKARKTELTALVTICYGNSIAEGFNIAQMIIKVFNFTQNDLLNDSLNDLLNDSLNSFLRNPNQLFTQLMSY
jgi:zinc finger FYVE domain-containing protein 26